MVSLNGIKSVKSAVMGSLDIVLDIKWWEIKQFSAKRLDYHVLFNFKMHHFRVINNEISASICVKMILTFVRSILSIELRKKDVLGYSLAGMQLLRLTLSSTMNFSLQEYANAHLKTDT